MIESMKSLEAGWIYLTRANSAFFKASSWLACANGMVQRRPMAALSRVKESSFSLMPMKWASKRRMWDGTSAAPDILKAALTIKTTEL